MIFCYRVYGEATLSWIYRLKHIAVSEKLSPSTENHYLYLSPSTEIVKLFLLIFFIIVVVILLNNMGRNTEQPVPG